MNTARSVSGASLAQSASSAGSSVRDSHVKRSRAAVSVSGDKVTLDWLLSPEQLAIPNASSNPIHATRIHALRLMISNLRDLVLGLRAFRDSLTAKCSATTEH
jgi:hypothetical protein